MEPIKNRSEYELVRAYKKVFIYLSERGYKPSSNWLDNEAPDEMRAFERSNNVDVQLTPPHVHRRSAAERAIRIFKNHFVEGLCSTDEQFPMYLWDKLLEQAQITLNLLRPCRENENISAYHALEGGFDFNRTPLEIPGAKIIAHSKPSNRKSLETHGQRGFYVGPAMHHYRCWRVYITKTRSLRVTDTIHFVDEVEMTYDPKLLL